MRNGAAAIVLCFLCGPAIPSARPRPSPATAGPHANLRLIADESTLEPGRDLDLGLLFDLEPHWHIYWINPGDSGEPPSVTWKLPGGFQAMDLEWPAPERLVNGPITDYGYQGRVLLIAPVRVPSTIKEHDVAFSAEVRWLVCSDVCISEKADVSVELPVERVRIEADVQSRGLFQVARRRLPQPLPRNWRVSIEDEGKTFRIRLNTGARIRQASFFPLEFDQVDNAQPQNAVPLASGVEVDVQKSDQLLKPLQELKGVLVIDGDRAYQVTAPVKRG